MVNIAPAKIPRDERGYVLPGYQIPGYIPKKRKYTTYEELYNAVVKFLDHCKENEKPLTIERFCTFLGITRQTLINYEAYHKEQLIKPTDGEYGTNNSDSALMLDLLRAVRAEILADRIDMLIDMKNRNANGTIFLLKNSHGYKDRIDHVVESIVIFTFISLMRSRRGCKAGRLRIWQAPSWTQNSAL